MKIAILKRGFIFFLLAIHIQFAQIIYFKQSEFLNRYDISYWKDRYEHSQYQLPLSKRIIGDDGLFAFAGYRVIHGDAPFSINIDKPPLGKYLIGIFIVLFSNPAYYALFFGIGSLILFYHIAKKLFQDSLLTYFATILLFLDPLFFSQFWKPWLDISQLFFLLLNFFLLTKIKKNIKFLIPLLCGIALGFFIEIKPPILLPVIFILETSYMFINRLLKQYVYFICGITLGVIVPYFTYFNENGIITILKLHKYMYSLYYQSQLKVNIGAIWQVIGFGRFPDIVTGVPTYVSEWWVLWPLCTIVGLTFGVRLLFNKTEFGLLKIIYLFTSSSLIIFTFIPSYTRYLIILLPFIYLLAIKTIDQLLSQSLKNLLFMFVSVFGIIHAGFFLYPHTEGVLTNFYYNFSHQYFQDVYQENIAVSNKPLQNRQEFKIVNQRLLWDATVKSIGIEEKERNIPIFSNVGTVKIQVTYKTLDLGPFVEDKVINLIKENNQWKIKWDWNIVLNKFLPGNYIEVNTQLGKRGTIFDHTGRILVQDKSGYLVLVNPEKINLKKEQEMLKFMQSYKYKISDYFQNEYLENTLPNTYVPLFTFFKPITDIEKNRLLSYAGVRLIDYPARVYIDMDPFSIKNVFYEECCTRIYSSYNYHGVKDFEKEYNSILAGYSGGAIVLKNPNGELVRIVLDKKTKNGENIVAY